MSKLFGKKEREGESGHKAADQTRDGINKVRDAGEDARKNVNAFSDNLVGGNQEHGGTDVHDDAKKVEDGVKDATDTAGKKVDDLTTPKEKKKKSPWEGLFGGDKEKKDKGKRVSWFGGDKKK